MINKVDTLKILLAKLQPFINEENKYMEKFQTEIEKLKEDLELQRKTMETQINILRAENDELLNEIEKMRSEEDVYEDRIRALKPLPKITENSNKNKDEHYNLYLKYEEELSNYKANFEQVISILREEEKNRLYLEEEINSLHNQIQNLRDEINIMTNKHDKKCQDYETLDKINNGK